MATRVTLRAIARAAMFEPLHRATLRSVAGWAGALACLCFSSFASAQQIVVNELYRNGNLTATDEWVELVLQQDLTAAQLEGFFIGDSTGATAAKFGAFRLQNMSGIASTFRAGTIIVLAGQTGPAEDLSYNPAGGDFNLIFRTNNARVVTVVAGADFAADDVAWVDTASSGSTIASGVGFCVTWDGSPLGTLGAACGLTIPFTTNNAGARLDQDFSGIVAGDWSVGVAAASLSPGQPNGGSNTIAIQVLQNGAAPTVYVAGNGGQFGRFDLATRAYTQISANAFASAQITGMAYRTTTGVMYVNARAGTTELRTVNPASGAMTTVAAYDYGGVTTETIGIAFDAAGSQFVYNFGNDAIFSVNPATAVGTQLSPAAVLSSTAPLAGKLAFAGSTLCGAMALSPASSNGLYSFNTTNGAATSLGNGGAGATYANMVTFSNGNTLYGINGATLYQINLANGALTNLGAIAGANMPASVLAATIGRAPAGVILTQSGGNTAVTEGGATDSYTLVLNSQPTANVSIALNPGAQLTVATSPVVFTTANWATPQTVTVTAVDDAVVEGAHSGTITHTVSSSDTAYNGFPVANVVVAITDNDIDPCTAISFPYTLPDNAPATLITAIQCANANGTADVIDLDGRTVTLTAAHANYTGATGLPRITTTVTLENGTITRSGGAPQFRQLAVSAAGNLTVNGVTVSGGSLSSADNAGAIFNDGGTLNIVDSTVSGNSAGFGGAIYNSAGTLAIVNSQATGNSASQNGGFLMNDSGSAAIVGSTVSGNSSSGPSGNGAIYSFEATLNIVDSTFSGNTATTFVGAVQNFNGTTDIANSVFAGNSAANVGAVMNNGGGTMTVSNSRFSGNRATNSGGALVNNVASTLTITNSTFAGNNATSSGGINIAGGSTATISNSILWGNNGNTLAGASITWSTVEGGFAGTGNLAVDPLFVSPVAFASAPTTAGDYRLQDHSPAIDAGNNAAVRLDTYDLNDNSQTTDEAPDLDGNPRRYDDTGVADSGSGSAPIVDLGAYEKQTNSPPLFPMDVDYCNLQFPTSFSAAAGGASPVIYGRIYEDDNGVLTSTPGAHPSIVAEVGHGPLGSDPRGGNPAWQWFPAAFNVQVGNDDEYQGTFTVPFAPTNMQRSYTYRFSVDSGANYTYCDSDGNGTNGGLGFSTASLGTLTINSGGQPTLGINDVTQNEGNSGTTAFGFTISLNGPSLNAVSFDMATANNTATVANADYVANSATGVVIPAGQTSASFTVLVNGDITLEPNETFFVNVTNVTGAVVGDGQGTGTIVNDEVDPCAAILFPYTMSGNTPAELIQAIQCANANGAGSDSIDLDGQTVTLVANHVTISGTNNGLPEITTAVVVRNGTITRSSADPFRFFFNSGNLTLDNITLSNGDAQSDGGAILNIGASTLTVNRSRIIGNSGNFGGAIFNGSADTTTLTNTLVSGNRANSQGGGIRNRGVLVLNNSTVAANFTTTGAEGGGGIANAGTFSLTLNNSLVFGNEAQNFPATNEIVGVFTANNSLVGVNPGFVGALDASDSAPTTAGDYRLGPLSVATDAGANALIPVGVTTDLDGNPRRYDDANVPDSGSGTAPIVDLGAYERQVDSIAPVVTVTPTTLSVSESGPTTDTFLVALDTVPPTNVTIALSFDGQVQVNAGSGFGVSPQTVTLTPANALAGVTVTVRAVDDAVDEAGPHATTIVTGASSSATPAFNGLAVADVAVNILDNDTAGIAVTESAGSTAAAEGGAGDSYDVVLLSQPTANVTMAINPNPQLTVAPTSVTFTSANWNAPQTVTVTAVNDTVVEGTHNGSITHSVTSTDAGYDGLGVTAVTATISDNDTAEIIFSSAGFTAVEGAQFSPGATLKVTANGAPGGSVAAEIVAAMILTPGTASTDDVAVSGSFVFPAGSTHDTVVNSAQITVTDDRAVEASESFDVALSVSSGLATAGAVNTYTVADNDSAAIGFALPTSNAPEGSTPHGVNALLTITGVGSGPLLLEDAASVVITDTPGTATTPADYTRTTASISFDAGSPDGATRPIQSSIVDDALFEGNHDFALGFGAVTAASAGVTAAGSHTVTITDNDPMPTISISSPSQPEGNGGNTPMTFTVSLSSAAGVDVTFTRATADGTATLVDNDYVQLTAAGGSIPTGDTSLPIVVQIVGDTSFEGNEDFRLDLTDIVNATVASPPLIEGTLPVLSGVGTIEDDDQQPTTTTISSDDPDASVVGQPYTVVVNVAAVSLSPSGTVTVSDGSASCGPVAVAPATSPNSTASCVLTSTTAGAKTLTATYTADSSAFADSNGTTAHQVNAAATSISVSGPPRSRINQPTTFTFALSVEAPGAGAPAGTVTLTSGASTCSVTVPTATPSCALAFGALGQRTVSAAFVPSDGNFLGSASSSAGNAQTLVFALSDIAVTKSDGVGTFRPGDLVVYTVTVRNLGADAAAQIRVIDNVPAGLVDVVWTCDASGGVACPQAGGSGNLDVIITSFPVGGLLNYTFYGNVDGRPAQLVNTALVQLPADTTIEDPVPGNNSATDTNLLELLFRNGFEAAAVNAPNGSFRLPSASLRGALDEVAIVVYGLDDANGEALRVYARVNGDELQFALATRNAQGRLRLGDWASYASDPLLTWTARPVAGGWVLDSAGLR